MVPPSALRLGHLGGLQVGGDEHHGAQPQGRGGPGDGRRQVAGGRARERREAELDRARGGHAHHAVLEREGRVARVILDPQPLQPEAGGQAGSGRQRRHADAQATRGKGLDGKELGEAPDGGGTVVQELPGEAAAEAGEVVGGFKRAEAPGADEDRTRRVRGATRATAEAAEAGREGVFCGRGRAGRDVRLRAGGA